MLRLSWIILSCLLLIGCTPSDRSIANSERPATESLAQELPITAEVEIGGETIKLEVANTPKQQAIGLMYREEMPKNRGMLFPMDPPRVPRFWMKNVEVTLDMIFVRNGKVSAIAHQVPPCEEDPCPTYSPDVVIDQVIELQGGRAQELGLEIGDSISVQFEQNE
ncbi:protein of unknown function DUF192 [Halothece sp. PCC 7418]|uniref:DUF192 domain-containing protein n=1 Tax=Halothece sp. (strain PCC 7418) TaxID=65093 RepID=UPI0002A08486|nr:DUF192 domain-containing protein [Halothece sp. PCC 7418]AFZ44629.1 protein of unknown function DUF192 [Halothece sp. PCC 7418]